MKQQASSPPLQPPTSHAVPAVHAPELPCHYPCLSISIPKPAEPGWRHEREVGVVMNVGQALLRDEASMALGVQETRCRPMRGCITPLHPVFMCTSPGRKQQWQGRDPKDSKLPRRQLTGCTGLSRSGLCGCALCMCGTLRLHRCMVATSIWLCDLCLPPACVNLWPDMLHCRTAMGRAMSRSSSQSSLSDGSQL